MIKINSINDLFLSLRTCLKISSHEVKKLILRTLVLGICAASVEYLFALVIQDFFNHLKLFNLGGELLDFRSHSLEWSMGLLLIVGLVRSLLEGSKIYLARIAQQKFSQDMRFKLISRALNNAATVSSGKVLAMFSDETSRASISILNLSSLFIQLSLSMTLLAISGFNYPLATLIGLGLLCLFYMPLKLFEKSASQTGLNLSHEWEKTNYILTEGIRNNFYLMVIGKVGSEISKALKSLERYFQIYRKAFFLISLKTSLPSFLGICILVIIAYLYERHGVFNAQFSFMGFFYLFLRFTQAASQAVTLVGEFKINAESTKVLEKWISNNPDITNNKSQTWPFPNDRILELKLQDLAFSYDTKPLFETLNITIKSGETLVITGESGVGKSTLISLIMGLMHPTSGQILYNDKVLKDLTSALPSVTSYIGPHPFLVEGSVKDNLLYGVEGERSIDEISKSLKTACLTPLIEELKNGLDTKINEIGSSFSTGQKQRLMLARAILRRPKIIIMDEATANLDTQTENELITNMSEILKDKICIIVTHKESFNTIANHKIKLKKNNL